VIVSRAERGAGVPAYRFVVSGRVQGVGYRYFVLREAATLGVSGYARNQADGSVEVVVEGGSDALADLEARLREGPAFAEVKGVLRESIPERGASGFHVR
jgi:acylphosphatase